jgi:hypothetical protein
MMTERELDYLVRKKGPTNIPSIVQEICVLAPYTKHR